MRYLLAGLALLGGLSVFIAPDPAEARTVCHRNYYGELVCYRARPQHRGYYYAPPRGYAYAPRGYGYGYEPPVYNSPTDPNYGCPRGYTRQSGQCKPYRGY